MNNPHGLLTLQETAELLRVPVKTLRHYRQIRNEPVRSALIGGRVMYRRSDVEAYIEAAFSASA